MTRNSLVEIGPISQSTPPAGRVTKHETNENVQNVDLKPLDTRPHHVSGAAGLRRQCLAGESRPQGPTTTRAHTQRVEDDEKTLGTA